MLNFLKSFLGNNKSSVNCSSCDTTHIQNNCFNCSNDCSMDCSVVCSDNDTSGLSLGVCDSAGKGSTESGCLFCISSYSK